MLAAATPEGAALLARASESQGVADLELAILGLRKLADTQRHRDEAARRLWALCEEQLAMEEPNALYLADQLTRLRDEARRSDEESEDGGQQLRFLREFLRRGVEDFTGGWQTDERFSSFDGRGPEHFPMCVIQAAQLALSAPRLLPAGELPTLRRGHDASVSLSRLQVACLVAECLLGGGPREECSSAPLLSWGGNSSKLAWELYGAMTSKLLCALAYLRAVLRALEAGDRSFLAGRVTFRRVTLPPPAPPSASEAAAPLCPLSADTGAASDTDGDFGAGADGDGDGPGEQPPLLLLLPSSGLPGASPFAAAGCRVEDAAVLGRPECLAAALLCPEPLGPGEALVVAGARPFARAAVRPPPLLSKARLS
eukprot:tig00000113_g5659.t1